MLRGLFNKSKTDELLEEAPTAIVPINEVDQDAVVSFLRDLDKTEFDKVVKIANIYRIADKDARKVLNIPTQVISKDNGTQIKVKVVD